MKDFLRVVKSEGSGRAFVFVYEVGSLHADYAAAAASRLSAGAKTVIIESKTVSDDNWQQLSQELIKTLSLEGVRQSSLIGFEGGASLIQALYLAEPKQIRTMAFINASTRPHPSIFSRCVDWMESNFPLGLPLRLGSKGFDARPHLQKIRCPVLVITMPGATTFLQEEAKFANRAMPTSWLIEMTAGSSLENFCETIKQFQEVPAKCPQKNQPSARIAL